MVVFVVGLVGGSGGCGRHGSVASSAPLARPIAPARLWRLEALLRTAPLTIVAERRVEHGLSAPRVLTVELGGQRARIKWKEAAHGGDGQNRSPRHELAAWAVQRLFLDGADDVVPPTAVRCLPVRQYEQAFGRPARPTFEGTSCVLGTVAWWLDDVDELDGLDEGRLRRDPAYRRTMADLNVLTYLIDHRDAKDANFVISRPPAPARAWSVDNGLAFSGFRTLRGLFVRDWSQLRVGALRRTVVDRLRRVTHADLERLAVLAEFRVRDGQLVEVAPGPPLPDVNNGARRSGDVIQLGPTRGEIDDLARRLGRLRDAVDAGQLASFDDAAAAPPRRLANRR